MEFEVINKWTKKKMQRRKKWTNRSFQKWDFEEQEKKEREKETDQEDSTDNQLDTYTLQIENIFINQGHTNKTGKDEIKVYMLLFYFSSSNWRWWC